MAKNRTTVKAIITLEIDVDCYVDCSSASIDMPGEHIFEYEFETKKINENVREKVREFLLETMEDWSQC